VFRTLLACLATTALACAQIPLGHAVLLTDSPTAAGALWLYEPLTASFTPIDTSSLPAVRISAMHMFARGQRLLLAASAATTTDDGLLMTAIQGNALSNPTPFAQGLRGRALTIIPTPSGVIVVVTAQAAFSVPATGGMARLLTASTPVMNNRDAVLLDPNTVAITTADLTGQATLWLLEVATGQLRTVPLRVASPASLGDGPALGTVLVGDPAGQLMSFNPLTLARAPWSSLGRPAERLLPFPEPRGWFATLGRSILPVRGQLIGTAIPSPAGPVLDIDYRIYESVIAAYGTACPGSNTLLPAVAWQGRPLPGARDFSLTLADGRANSVAALMIGGTAIDTPLDSFAMPGCRLLTQPLLSLTLNTSSTGQAILPFPIPPQASLAGAQLFAQWLVVDPGVNGASLVTSNGARIEI
jgi:hypothetical protein